jgi:hypothetical protein
MRDGRAGDLNHLGPDEPLFRLPAGPVTGLRIVHRYLTHGAGHPDHFATRPELNTSICILGGVVCMVYYCIKVHWSAHEGLQVAASLLMLLLVNILA